EKFSNSEVFKKIDNGVKNEGWRILMITRLVPVFPFSIQNYIYGLTGINFFLFWGLSTLFIIPGSAAYTLSVGAVLDGSFSATNLIYLGVGAICFVLVSFIPKFIKVKE
ncbi:MAG: TVP38/TMEM64 family protein, partial [Brevinema sp.]